MGECEEEKATHSYVESRNRTTFIVGVSVGLAVVGIGTFVAYKVATGVIRSIW